MHRPVVSNDEFRAFDYWVANSVVPDSIEQVKKAMENLELEYDAIQVEDNTLVFQDDDMF